MTEKNQKFDVFRTPCLAAHVEAVLNNSKGYVDSIEFLIESGTFATIPSAVQTSAIVVLYITSHHKALTRFMHECEVTEILKALTMLDNRRLARQLAHKIENIENEHPELVRLPKDEPASDDSDEKKKRKSRRRKIDVYRRKLRAINEELSEACPDKSTCIATAHADTAVQETIQSASGVSGALAQKVRNWANTVTSERIEHIMLTNSKAPWRKLSDIVHFCPSDFAVSYFLADIHNVSIPESCFVARMRAFVKAGEENDNVVEDFRALASELPQVYLAYPFLRLYPFIMKEECIAKQLAAHMPVNTVIWNFEELHRASNECKNIVLDRLKRHDLINDNSGNIKTTTFGKLMERILTFRRLGLEKLADALLVLANSRLEMLKSFWSERVNEQKVAVIGDASASMQVAIESATIFAAMVSVCLQGELSFYNSKPIASPVKRPRNVKEALHVCSKVRATGCTSPAAALYKYVAEKQWVDLFVHVTDEYENTRFNNESHASLLARYKREVNPNVQVVIVCVGRGNRSFRNEMESESIDYRVVSIDDRRPDLAKYDSLLGQLVKCSVDGEMEGDDEFVIV